MREIKFRAKIKGDAGVYQVWTIDWLWQRALISRACGDEWVSFEKIEAFLEWTGLKDKNGKEIFEGDILDRNDTILCVVTFEDGKFGWNIQYKKPRLDQRKDCFGRSYANQEEASKLEVIGNIYENKELLEE